MYLFLVMVFVLFALVLALFNSRLLEKTQHRATEVILNDNTSDYKSRLLKLKLLSLMYVCQSSFLITVLIYCNKLFPFQKVPPDPLAPNFAT